MEYRKKDWQERVHDLKHSQTQVDLAVHNSMPFMFETTGLIIGSGFNLIAGKPGDGKSVTLRNLVANAFRFTPKDIIVMLNEESISDLVYGVACVGLHISFLAWRNNQLPPNVVQHVDQVAMSVLKRLEIIDNASCIEQVMGVYEGIAKDTQRVGLVCLENIQNVNRSSLSPHLEQWQVSKQLGYYLKDYCRNVAIPNVVFAQLYPDGKGGTFSERIQGDKQLYNHASTALELWSDKASNVAEFRCHKDRFGVKAGQSIRLGWKDGYYEPLTNQSF